MRYLILCLCLATCHLSPAQQSPLCIGVTETIRSAELNENRLLNIYLPEGYTDTASYPVIYLLDGSANEDFIHTAGLAQYLSMYEIIPASIVVGIANVNRRRDFTGPTSVAEDIKLIPVNGGSEKFIAFIEKELQPYIEKNYRTKTERTIIGQSLGGLLATEILLTKPALFSNYMIISPSLWWNKEQLLGQAKELLGSNLRSKVNVYVSVGTEGKQMETDAKRLFEILRTSSNKNITAYFAPFPEESHLTILHRSLYKGFEMLYSKNRK
jgi:predicted alpha/beta superfamily hydrolase